EKSPGADRVANHLEPLTIGRSRIDGRIVQPAAIDARRVLGNRVLAIEFIVLKSPRIEGGELTLQEFDDARMSGIERRRGVVEHRLSGPVAQVPVRVLAHRSRIGVRNQPQSRMQPALPDVTSEPLRAVRKLALIPFFYPVVLALRAAIIPIVEYDKLKA